MKLNKKYLAPLCSLLVTGGLLVSIAVLTLGSSFGWFSNNDKVSASGISVSSVSPYNMGQTLVTFTYDADGNITGETELSDKAAAELFSGMLPTNKRTVYLRVRNSEKAAMSLEILLSAPSKYDESTDNGSDSEFVKDNLYHYFGSQIRISEIAAFDKAGNGGKGSLGTSYCTVKGTNNAYLLTMPATDSNSNSNYQGTGGTPNTGFSEPYDFSKASQKKLTSAIPIPAAIDDEKPSYTYYAITFEFVDNGKVQNAYINFGSSAKGVTAPESGYRLSRTLLCWYSEAETQE